MHTSTNVKFWFLCDLDGKSQLSLKWVSLLAHISVVFVLSFSLFFPIFLYLSLKLIFWKILRTNSAFYLLFFSLSLSIKIVLLILYYIGGLHQFWVFHFPFWWNIIIIWLMKRSKGEIKWNVGFYVLCNYWESGNETLLVHFMGTCKVLSFFELH